MIHISKSGIKYINYDKSSNKWKVVPNMDNRILYLGKYETLEEATTVLLENGFEVLPSGNHIYSLDVNYFKSIDSKEKAFWFGFICADGSLTVHDNGRIQFRISQKEKDLIELFSKDIKYTGRLKEKSNISNRYSQNKFYELDISRTEFSNNLLNSGKAIYKSEQKQIPKTIPQEFIFDFIRGYFEGDGSIYRDATSAKGYVFLAISGYRELLEEIKSYFDKALGYSSGSISKNRSICKFKCKSSVTDKLINLLYDNARESNLSPKYIKYKGMMSIV